MNPEEQAVDYLDVARHMSSIGNYADSFDLYLVTFDKDPRQKEACEAEFRAVLIQLSEILLSAGKMEEIFENFGTAVDAFPRNCHLLNDIGKYLYKFRFYTEAWNYFQKALGIDPSFVNAEKNINSLKNFLLERWHFRMLNDKIRNDAYYDAIKINVTRHKDSVLDIGTGTGIFALFASQFSTTAVTAIEASEVMAWMAESVTQGNNVLDIIIVNKMSTTLNYMDIGGKRSLIVTEMFDAGLFGEHVLQTLSHAWEYFSIPTTRIIPNKAEFFVVAARSDYLNRRYQLGAAAKNVLNISNMHVHMFSDDETYDCEDIHLIKDVRYISEPKSLLQVNFNDYLDIQEKLNHTEPYPVQFTAKEDSQINIVIGWFNLYLTEDITLTTDPRAENRANAWQQAVFFDNIPKKVMENQVVDAEFLLNGDKLTMLPYSNTEIIKISPEALRFLNDDEYMKLITSCIGITCIYLGQMADITEITIVDLCPFPLFGMLMLKRGAKSLTCYARLESDKKFFKEVFQINGIDWERVKLLEGEDWSHETFGAEKYHAIFCNVLDLSGDIDSRLREVSQQLKIYNLVQGGLYMPAKIKLMGQIVNSPWLNINNRVYDGNFKRYKLAQYINKYEVTQNFFVDFTSLEHTPVTEPTCMGPLYSDVKTETLNFPISVSSEANAILCWYDIELTEDSAVVSTKRPGSFIDGTLFLISPPVPLMSGRVASLARLNDDYGSYKIEFRNEFL